MADKMDPRSFEVLYPSQFISFTFPNPNPSTFHHHQSLLRVAVLDSPFTSSSDHDHGVAAMLVPVGRENDWIFSTETGHLQLLLSSTPSPSRLILVGDQSQSQSQSEPYFNLRCSDSSSLVTEQQQQQQQLKNSILPLLLALSPKSAFNFGIPQIPFLSYDDDVARIVPVDRLVGPIVGEMVVEDVELVDAGEWRRRLRFKGMPNLVQSQVRLLSDNGHAPFRPQTGSLVQPYLGAMVAALSLLSPTATAKKTIKALCLGVGGGDLLMCLRHQFGLSVMGVEVDEVVLSAAKRQFGLVEDDSLQIVVGDGIKMMITICNKSNEQEVEVEVKEKFDVIMVDLDSGDDGHGMTSAPPMEFVKKSVLSGARLALAVNGIMVVNAIMTTMSPRRKLVDALSEVFDELYEIDVGNGQNYVFVAVVMSVTPLGLELELESESESESDGEKKEEGRFFQKMKELGVDRFVDCIKRLF